MTSARDTTDSSASGGWNGDDTTGCPATATHGAILSVDVALSAQRTDRA